MLRMRVASSDWCASRIAVSVSSTRSSRSIQLAKRSGPSSSSFCLAPGGGAGSVPGGSRGGASCAGCARPRVSGLPLTIVAPMRSRMRVARSRLRGQRNSSGVSSMKRVVYSPCTKRGCVISWSRNLRLVTTPRTRNSHRARCMRAIASSGVGAQALTLTSSES
jgi:hypothetical protein